MALFQNNATVEADKVTSGFEPFPEGVYDFVIYEVETSEFKSAKNGGKPRLVADLKVTGPDHAGRRIKDFAIPLFTEDGNDWANRKVKDFFVTALGYESFEAVSETLEDPEDLLGEEIKAVVGIEEDQNGEPRNVIKRYVAPDYEPSNVKAPAPVKKAKKPSGKKL